ncbi:MAG: Stk1 family PASTA domain-containing Ser/Thr kinase [Lachnospiraceae bacterium]|nr:Stk1 family PASTA domain-containing Ser/Thr kinase [Lachnospiraceae bacterium]
MLRKGMFIGDRYEVISHIGVGGMADVYKGKDHKLNRFVAIKVLKDEFRNDRNFVSKFRAEAQAAARLAHPNVVNVYDVGDEDGINYIIMELVEGITLKNYIERKGKLTVRETTSIAIQVAMGIEAAHNINIVHRDIKPQNIIISREGKVKVTDFGIAKVASSNTISSVTMGSVHYTSPEQARGGYSDAKSDIYSLGIVMYEMITGRVPFDGETAVSVAVKHLQEEMVPPHVYAPDIPLSLEQIIQKCTEKSQERRYANTGELLKDLKQSLVTPNASFVKFVSPDENAKTVMFTKSDMDRIKQESGHYTEDDMEASGRQPVYVDDDYEDEDDRYDDDYDDDYEDGYEDDGYDDDGYEDDYEDDYDDDYDDGYDDDYDDRYDSRRSGRRRSSRYEDDDYEDEEKGGDGLNPNLEKIMFVGGIIVAVIIVCIIIVLIGKAFGLFKFGSKNKEDDQAVEEVESVEVPKLVGEQYADAQKALEGLGLLIKPSYEVSDDFEEGQIMSQSVKEGEMVDPGTTISVTVCSGEESFSLPSLENKEQSAAESALRELGLECVIESDYSDTVDVGKVISTNPASGSDVIKGQKITVIVSKGSEVKTGTVPTLANMTQADAQAAISAAGFKVGTVSEGYSDSVMEGRVISQSVNAGTKLEQGKSIDIVISKGADTVTVPSVVGSDFDDAKDTLEGLGFKVAEQEQHHATVGEGLVVSQSVDANTKAAKGTTITLYVSIGPESSEGGGAPEEGQ